jgi:hypothetical protein
MERKSFGTRAKERIWRETRSFLRGRVHPFFIAIIGIAFGFLINFIWLHKDTSRQLAILSVISLSGSYLIWFLLNLSFNTIRAPWLLDAESSQLLDGMEQRALTAEAALDEKVKIKQENERLHSSFGFLAQQGAQFLLDISRCSTRSEFASWDYHSKTWIQDVQSAIRNMGFPVDAVEFGRADASAKPVGGVMNTPNEQEQRRRRLTEHQNYLVEFTKRRLP